MNDLDTVATAADNESPPEAEKPDESSRLSELERLLVQKDEALGLANHRISELEQALNDLSGKLASAGSALSQSVASYRTLVIKANPGVIEELISGDSIDGINASLERTKALIARVRQGLEEESTKIKVPAGAPQRTSIDLSALTPREKILHAIGGKR